MRKRNYTGLSIVRGVVVTAALLMALVNRVAAQEFTIKKVELTPESVILHYDLIDTVKARTYSIYLYSSKDNFITPLQKVRGDVGIEVRPGPNRKITWASREELGVQFKGDVELEVRGRVHVPFIRFEGFHDKMVLKRGKPRTMAWSGGTRQNILTFGLYRDGQVVTVMHNIPNTGSHEITIPVNVKPGSGYYFIISDSKNKDLVMQTPTFDVARKISLGAKVGTVVAIGATYPLWSKIFDRTPDDLEGPPGTPANKN